MLKIIQLFSILLQNDKCLKSKKQSFLGIDVQYLSWKYPVALAFAQIIKRNREDFLCERYLQKVEC